jgi:hypothetical protein
MTNLGKVVVTERWPNSNYNAVRTSFDDSNLSRHIASSTASFRLERGGAQRRGVSVSVSKIRMDNYSRAAFCPAPVMILTPAIISAISSIIRCAPGRGETA